MRNWRVAAALGVLLASPLYAQQKADNDTSSRNETAAEKSSAGTSNAGANNAVAPSKNIFALPAVPRPKPFPKPGPAGGGKDSEAPGQLVPRYEISGMYFYVNASPGSPFD